MRGDSVWTPGHARRRGSRCHETSVAPCAQREAMDGASRGPRGEGGRPPPDVYLVLRRELADPRRPVGQRGAHARTVACATACAEQVVAGAAREERAAPVGVVAAARDV